MQQQKYAYIVTPNVDHVAFINKNDTDIFGMLIADIYEQADISVCDSRVLALLIRNIMIYLRCYPSFNLIGV